MTTRILSTPTQPRAGNFRAKPRGNWKKLFLLLLGIISLSIVGFVAAILLRPTAGEMKVPAGYLRNESRYLSMRDGVRIATDVWYPANLASNQKVPAIIRSTRYHRAGQVTPVLKVLRTLGIGGLPESDQRIADTEAALNEAGYAVVLVDARGSGASFGNRSIEWSADEVADLGEVIDWIVAQPWSNGKVGAYGISYDGNTAEMTAVPNRSALKAVAPHFDDFDPQSGLAIPGGVFNVGFIKDWSFGNEALDYNYSCEALKATGLNCFLIKLLYPGVKRVDEDRHGQMLAAAVAQRQQTSVFASMQDVEYRDDRYGLSGQTLGEVSPYHSGAAIEKSGAAIYTWVGWLDGGTVDGALSRYLTWRNPQQLVIGPWSHGGWYHIDPFLPDDTPTDPAPAQQNQNLITFFDQFLKDDSQETLKRSITYYVLGADEWKTTDVWPPAGVQAQRWYFGHASAGRGLLSRTAPSEPSGADEYRVDFTATTGDANRWVTQLGGPDVVYPNRATEDKKLLTYTSEPLSTDVEIIGSPVVTLYVNSTASDGAFYVYLEDVAPDGRVTYITEGILRALHRKVSTATPPYKLLGPYHSFLRADAAPLTPGEVETIPITLFATAVRIHQGHQLRVSVAGHDASMFRRYPAEGEVVLQVQRNTVYASSIELPMLAQP